MDQLVVTERPSHGGTEEGGRPEVARLINASGNSDAGHFIDSLGLTAEEVDRFIEQAAPRAKDSGWPKAWIFHFVGKNLDPRLPEWFDARYSEAVINYPMVGPAHVLQSLPDHLFRDMLAGVERAHTNKRLGDDRNRASLAEFETAALFILRGSGQVKEHRFVERMYTRSTRHSSYPAAEKRYLALGRFYAQVRAAQ